MPDRVHQNSSLIYSVGTQVVVLRDVVVSNGRTLHPCGAVGVALLPWQRPVGIGQQFVDRRRVSYHMLVASLHPISRIVEAGHSERDYCELARRIHRKLTDYSTIRPRLPAHTQENKRS